MAMEEMSCPGAQELHVLAVDDSHVDRKVVEKLLKISCCKVTAVESGRRALQFLGLDGEKSSVGFDALKVNLIITDYSMPGMTGFELLKKIKGSSALRKIPVVIMSSENVLARIDRCLEEGAEEFLVKPVKLSDVKRIKDFILKGEGEENEKKEDLISRELAENERKEDLISRELAENEKKDDLVSRAPAGSEKKEELVSRELAENEKREMRKRKLIGDPSSPAQPLTSSPPPSLAGDIPVLSKSSSSAAAAASQHPHLKRLRLQDSFK